MQRLTEAGEHVCPDRLLFPTVGDHSDRSAARGTIVLGFVPTAYSVRLNGICLYTLFAPGYITLFAFPQCEEYRDGCCRVCS